MIRSGNRFVVLGNCELSQSIRMILQVLLGDGIVIPAESEQEAKSVLWNLGDSPHDFDKIHLLVVTSSQILMTPSQLFRIHCRLRPSERQSGTLLNFGPGWSGAIVFVGTPSNGLEELARLEPFSKIIESHLVLPVPFSVHQLLKIMSVVKPLYAEQWKQQLLAIGGFAKLKHSLNFVETSASSEPARSIEAIQSAIKILLSDTLLEKLFAHREVRGGLRQLLGELELAKKTDVAFINNAVKRLRDVLQDYL